MLKSWLLLSTCLAFNTFDENTETILIAHRGEPAFQPEETKASYVLASLEGAEYLEPDLVLTKDFHIVCFHDVDLGSITNVGQFPEFVSRKKNVSLWNEDRYIDIKDAYLINEFTLQELRKITVNQRQKGLRPDLFNGHFGILSFEEYLDIVVEYSQKMKKEIGLVPELKHPRYFVESMQLPSRRYFEDSVVKLLYKKGFPLFGNSRRNGFSRVTLQCFEQDPLQYLKSKTDWHLMFLVEFNARYLTPQGIANVSQFADSLSFWKEYATVGTEAEFKYKKIAYDNKQIEQWGGFVDADQLVPLIHLNGLRAVIYTLYTSTEPSMAYCAIGCKTISRQDELNHYFRLGVDAMFVENYSEARLYQRLFYQNY